MILRNYTYEFNDKKISYEIWFSDDNLAVDRVIFLGTVQINKLTQWVAEACPPRSAIIQGAPHWHAKEDGSDILGFMLHYTKVVFDAVIADCQMRQCDIIVDSQAVPGVLRLFTQPNYKSYMNNMVLLQPLGFNNSSFFGTDNQRMAIFGSRIIKNTCHQLVDLLIDSRLRYNYRLLSKTVNFRDSKTRAQYNGGLKYDSVFDLQDLVQANKNVAIICGEKDKIFIADEIKNNLRRIDLSIEVVIVKNIAHSPLASKKGRVLLGMALEYLNSNRL